MISHENEVRKVHKRKANLYGALGVASSLSGLALLMDPLVESLTTYNWHLPTLPLDVANPWNFPIPSLSGHISHLLPGSTLVGQQVGVEAGEALIGTYLLIELASTSFERAGFHLRRA